MRKGDDLLSNKAIVDEILKGSNPYIKMDSNLQLKPYIHNNLLDVIALQKILDDQEKYRNDNPKKNSIDKKDTEYFDNQYNIWKNGIPIHPNIINTAKYQNPEFELDEIPIEFKEGWNITWYNDKIEKILYNGHTYFNQTEFEKHQINKTPREQGVGLLLNDLNIRDTMGYGKLIDKKNSNVFEAWPATDEDPKPRQIKIYTKEEMDAQGMEFDIEPVDDELDCYLNIIEEALREGKMMDQEEPEDIVNRPKHYSNGDDDPYEVIKIIEHFGFDKNSAMANVTKYTLRHEKKNGLEDLKKAQWYLNRHIKRIESGEFKNEYFK